MATLASGCFDTDKGPPPPANQFYYPTGMVASPGGKALFVANSDFDLQFKAGTVQALDLERLRKLLPRPDANDTIDCAAFGLGVNDGGNALLYPSPCTPININAPPDGGGSLVRVRADIGAFSTDLVLVRRPLAPGSTGTASKARLLVPVRGDPSVTWFDIDDDSGDNAQSFKLECGQGGGSRCGDDHRAGLDKAANLRSLTLPGEPFEMAASDNADALVLSHQTSGAASLLLNGWPPDEQSNNSSNPLLSSCAAKSLPYRPQLAFVLGGLSQGVTGVAALPAPRLAALFPEAIPYTPAFLLSVRTASEIDMVRYYDDCQSAPSRAFLSLTARVGISANAGGFDSRSISIDPTERHACEDACPQSCLLGCTNAGGSTEERLACKQACSKDESECLSGCAGIPVGVYVANRTPPSLLVGHATGSVSQYGTDDNVSFGETIPLAQGASRVVAGHVIDRQGKPRPRVFVLCFDARLLYVYDPEAEAIEAVVTTGRGPSTMVIDPVDPSLAYLAHFTDSYLAVLDLDMRHASTYLTLIASVGTPVPPRESSP